MAEVERAGFLRVDHLLEEAGLGLVLDVADGERTDAEGVAAWKRRAIHEQLHALDAGRRNRVHVGDDEQLARRTACAPSRSPARRQRRAAKMTSALAMISRFWASVSPATAVEIDAEALLRDLGRLDDAIDAAMGDELHVSAFERRDDRGGEADDAGGAEHGDLECPSSRGRT